MNEITSEFGINASFFVAQVVNALIIIGSFALAAKAILTRGKGWEVPVWLILSFLIPVIFPIIALIHFRKSKPARTESAEA